jgi:hypothetical protein
MKKKMKKLWAVLMAVAMVFSLASTALANETPEPPIPSQPYGGNTGTTTEYELPAPADPDPANGGSVSARSTSEGPLPDDPIEIILPTVTAATEGQMGVFDMILDPHNMIKKTNGDRYKVEGKTKTFAPVVAETEESEEGEEGADEAETLVPTDAAYPKLYFATKVDATAGTEEYSGTSQTLKIINKSRKDVNVDLSLDFKYPEDIVNLVDNESDLQNAENGLNAGGAQMYLALVRGSGEDVQTKAVRGLPADDEETTDIDESNVLPTFYVDGEGDYLAEGGVVFEWVTDDADIKADVGNLTFTVSYAAPVPAAEEDDTTTTDIDETIAVPAKIAVTGAWGDTYVVVGDEVTTDSSFNDDGVATITATVKASSADDAATLATATFTLVQPNYRTMKEDDKQVVHFKAPVAGAFVQTAIGFNKDAYTYAVWNGQGDKPQGTTDTGYYWKQASSQEVPDDDYPFVTFKLVGNINNDLAWDQIVANDTNISFDLIWNVLQRSTYNGNITLAQELVDDGGDEEPTEPQGNLPTISYTKTTSSSKTLTITWTKGTGDYEDFVPSTTVTTTSGKTLTMTPTTTSTGGTLKNTAANSTLASGDKVIVTFSDPDEVFEAVTVTGTTAAK